jgi:acyl-CoA oxidase
VGSCNESSSKLKSQPNLEETLDKLKETHATSAGLKAFCTWACLDTIDKCRQSCGGHGYSAYSNFPGMYADFAVQVSDLPHLFLAPNVLLLGLTTC